MIIATRSSSSCQSDSRPPLCVICAIAITTVPPFFSPHHQAIRSVKLSPVRESIDVLANALTRITAYASDLLRLRNPCAGLVGASSSYPDTLLPLSRVATSECKVVVGEMTSIRQRSTSKNDDRVATTAPLE